MSDNAMAVFGILGAIAFFFAFVVAVCWLVSRERKKVFGDRITGAIVWWEFHRYTLLHCYNYIIYGRKRLVVSVRDDAESVRFHMWATPTITVTGPNIEKFTGKQDRNNPTRISTYRHCYCKDGCEVYKLEKVETR